jgi:ribulose-phosphate 3-epimerase
MLKIAPSILSARFNRLEQEITEVVEAGADLIHLDVMDGVFVPNITFGPVVIQDLPRFEKVEYDAHLMIVQPENHLQAFFDLGVDRISVHVEAAIHLQRILQTIRARKVKPAVALNPATPLSTIEWILEDIDMVLIMTVNPGFGGQAFLPTMLEKIERLKAMIQKRGLAVEIEVDGGVTADNVRRLVDAGVDIAVAGSAVFGKPDYAAAISALKQ